MLKAHGLEGVAARKLQALYRATGIAYRHSVIPDYTCEEREFYPDTADLEPFPTVEQRMNLYRSKALGLAMDAINDCLDPLPGFECASITHLITVSCTGMYAPGLDIELVDKMGLSSSVERTAINYMGCYAAVNAVRLADSICKSNPGANVLIICLELCSIHFQKNDDPDSLLANALFSDGAAAVLQCAQPGNSFQLSPRHFHCNLINQGKQDMAWQIGNFGFEMRLSAYVPKVIESGVRRFMAPLMEACQLKMSEIDYFAIHPGGKLILEVVERELNIDRDRNRYAFEVLKNHGNMSSVSILFVLKKIIDRFQADSKAQGTILGMAFGPGITLESLVLSISGKG